MRNLRVQNCAGLLLVAIINPALAQAHPGPQAPVSETALVTPDNFNRAETDMYFGGSVKEGGLGTFRHNREAIPIDKQMVIRMNRDTLYSLSVFDLDAGPVTVTLPNPGQRFMSMQVIDEDHYTPEVIYGTGSYTFTREKIGTRYVSLTGRSDRSARHEAGTRLTGCDYGHSAGWPGAVRSAQLGSGKPEEGARGASGVG